MTTAVRRCLPALGILVLAGGCPRSAGDRPADLAVTPPAPRDAASPRRAWPAFPRGAAAARAVLAGERRRACDAEDAVELGPLVRRALSAEEPRWIAGERAIHAWIADRLAVQPRDAYLLWGTFHDAPPQLAAFRRLIGPGGPPGWTEILLEQLDAGSGWQGIHPSVFRGDDEPLRAYLRRGDRKAFRELMRRQRRLDYTAWKYGYLSEIADLIIAARATGVALLGCDMPRALQEIAPSDLELRDRLREVHCLLHLRDHSRAGPLRVAMLWGQSHVAAGAVPRFLPRGAAVLAVHVFGGRLAAQTPERALGQGLVLFDPLLVPLAPLCPGEQRLERALLLLPGAELAGAPDRARDPLSAAERGPPGRGVVQVRAEIPGALRLGGRALQVGRQTVDVEVAAGGLSFALHAGGKILVGALEVPDRGRVALALDPRRRAMRVVVQR